ncbi:hypothetical protein [Okeania sp. SIO1I7]|uniref:hypothetical protein n=1 Tax=Okeania sp. SIO1I7 TaxID=2607772 RepID=UPI0013F7A143|nr:hypothetical protein [Okeania sp. SIO1I7]NET28864.1 hypothetical protein [Okeania sp. SIO1I7]
MVLISTATLSSAVTSEEPVDINWLKEAGSPLVEWLKQPIASAGNFLNKVVEGGKALIESIQKGTFGKIFKQWAKDDPLAAAAGTIATGLAAVREEQCQSVERAFRPSGSKSRLCGC